MKNSLRNLSTRIAVAAMVAMSSVAANAAGIDDVFDAVDLAGIATKVGALALVIVAIALVFKGPDLAKRIIRKV